MFGTANDDDDDDWSDDDTAAPALPPPPPRAVLAVTTPAPPAPTPLAAAATATAAAPAAAAAAAAPASNLVLFLPVQVYASNAMTPIMAGAAILDDRPNHQHLLMFYDDAKRTILLHPLKAGNGVQLDVVPGQTACMLVDAQRSWKVVFRSKSDQFRFVALFCVCNGLAAAGGGPVPTVKFDLVRVDKKKKSPKPEHYAELRYHLWAVHADQLAQWAPEADFDFENPESGRQGEVKIGTPRACLSDTSRAAPSFFSFSRALRLFFFC